MVKYMNINGKRLLDNLYCLRTFTDTSGNGVTRFSYGIQDMKARQYIIKRAASIGCSISIDSIQNIRIKAPFNKTERKSVIAGSHIDTVRNGGWLDGIYGVCGALEVLETLVANYKTGQISDDELQYNYEVVIFAEEEGSGFGSTMTGSKFITGLYDESSLYTLLNDKDISLAQTLAELPAPQDKEIPVYNYTLKNMAESGDIDTANVIDMVRWDFDRIRAMLELHIEQGPVLDRKGLSLGIVESIFGMRVIEVTLTGVGNHAGATPMSERYDALCAAAECILAAEKTVRADEDRRTVVTAGKLEVLPNCSNVIPEAVKFTLEVRDKDENKINYFMDCIIREINRISDNRNIKCRIREHSKSAPLKLNSRLIDTMAEHAENEKLSYMIIDSGAVHDACMIAKYADTGMIFVPSINGRSHVPEENTEVTHLVAGAQFLMDAILYELTEE